VFAQRDRRRLLDDLLMPALNRALALDERQHRAVRVAEQLDLDVARAEQPALEVDRRVAERRPASERAVRIARRDRPGVMTVRMPLPPPPATALTTQRIADLFAAAAIVSHRRVCLERRLRARHDRRAAPSARLAGARSCCPIFAIACGVGPTKIRPASAHAWAKSSFSARKP
jgi:hypothetical protein